MTTIFQRVLSVLLLLLENQFIQAKMPMCHTWKMQLHEKLNEKNEHKVNLICMQSLYIGGTLALF